MISCRKIIGTAVIEIEHGVGLGSIHQVVVGDGVLLSYVVKSEHPNQAPYALLSGNDIRGIGNFAAMVKSAQVLRSISEEELHALTANQGAILDEMVVTVDGNKIGTAIDYQIDDQNEIGNLIVKAETDGEELQIPKSHILMIGKEFIILTDEVSDASHFSVKEETVDSVQHVVTEAEQSPVFEPTIVETVDVPAEEVVVAPTLDDHPLALEEEVEAPVQAESLEAAFEPTQEKSADEFDRDAIFAQFDAAAILGKKHQEAKEVQESAPAEEIVPAEASQPVTTNLYDFLTPPTEVEAVANSLDETVEDDIPTVSSLDNILVDEAVTSGSGPVIEAVKPQSLEEAFGFSPDPAESTSDNNVVEETASDNQSDARVVQMNFSPEEGNNFLAEQKRLLVGKKLQKDLIGPDGNPILFADEIVTDATIDLLRRIDRRLLVRLAGCVV